MRTTDPDKLSQSIAGRLNRCRSELACAFEEILQLQVELMQTHPRQASDHTERRLTDSEFCDYVEGLRETGQD